MKNKYGFLSIIVAMILVLTACGRNNDNQISAKTSESSEEESSSKISAEEEQAYKKIVDNYKLISMEDVKKIKDEKKDAFIYAGATYCPYCRAFVPILDKIAKEKGIDVYYLNSEKEGETFDAFAAEYKVEYIPAIFNIKSGEIKGYDTYYFNLPFEEQDIAEKIEKILK